ncbi:MAG: 50S ribosomal protein L29 [Bacteroidetes bacterium]|nr:MAG: 50S ribosomal protein L29 [Bacteroidota bacterium]
MKAKDIRDLTLEEVRARINSDNDRLLKLRLNHAVSAIENPSEIRAIRRDIARLKTILREREMAEVQTN